MKIKNILDSSFLELTGCIHNHSEYSYDSKVPLKKILKAAKRSELDYITINDHRTLQAKDDPSVLQEKDLIVIVGAEINDPQNNNHLLVFNTNEVLVDKTAPEYVNHYKNSGAVTFAAHPMEKRSSTKYRKYIWTDLSNDGFDGLEIWNYVSEWVGKLAPKFNGLLLVLFPNLFIIKPMRRIIAWWDKMNLEGKRKAAIGSLDSHEEKVKKFGILFKFLTHKSLFNSIRTNVLLEDGIHPQEKNILTALKKGNSYIVNYKIGIPYNFFAGMKATGQKAIICGQVIKLSSDLRLYFRLPHYARIILFHNGKKISSKFDDKGYFLITKPGNYRLEIFRFGRAWIFTNNFYVI